MAEVTNELQNPAYLSTQDIAQQLITPVSSYIALALVLLFILTMIIMKLVIQVENSRPELILFNSNIQKQINLLVSKQSASPGAMNNVHLAVSMGLMIPPANYEPPKNLSQGKLNSNTSADSITEVNDNKPKRSKKFDM
jgi:hypothetical protein